MSFIRFETCFDGEGALRGVVRLTGDLDRRARQDCLFDLEQALRQFACAELPEILRPRPLKIYPEAISPRTSPDPCATDRNLAGSKRFFDHLARVRQYLHNTPAVALRAERVGETPSCLAMLVFSGRNCRVRLTPAFEQLPARTRAQLLIDWRDSLVRQAALLLKESLV